MHILWYHCSTSLHTPIELSRGECSAFASQHAERFANNGTRWDNKSYYSHRMVLSITGVSFPLNLSPPLFLHMAVSRAIFKSAVIYSLARFIIYISHSSCVYCIYVMFYVVAYALLCWREPYIHSYIICTYYVYTTVCLCGCVYFSTWLHVSSWVSAKIQLWRSQNESQPSKWSANIHTQIDIAGC